MSHSHEEVEDCHKGANGTRITLEYDVVETSRIRMPSCKGDCGRISMGTTRASQSLPFGSTRHSPSLEAEGEVSLVHMDSQKAIMLK